MDSFKPDRWTLGTLLLGLAVPLLASACGPKVPPPPPEFADPQRTPTGVSRLEDLITEAEAFERMGDDEIEQMATRARSEVATDAEITSYVVVLVGHDRVPEATQFLFDRAWRAVEDQGKTADALGFAMGQVRWSSCAEMARELLRLRHSSGGFLIRGLCLERSGDHAGAEENIRAASEINPIAPDLLARTLALVQERSSSLPLPPADREAYDDLLLQFSRRETLDRLFVHELMGWPPDLPLGALDPGGLAQEDIRDVVASRARSYRHCYHLANVGSKKRHQLSGRSVIEFEIGPLGRAGNAHPALSDWKGHPKGPDLDRCLVEQIERLRFPRPRYGLVRFARHEFSFQPD